ncbi:MAG: RnfABCDGE type electron transport complex subunit A [Spirochaetales bacterium]|nr:RnfABCDGE type electron transport complex subunit A [Spirochaetales bacterium]MBP7264292.1 RnfABCDGE type electron transport complex subunit A [Spirochaetia bacterium]
MNLASIFISALLIDNIVLMRFLALCPFIGMSVDVNKSVGMGLAVIFVTVIATMVTWPIYTFILVGLDLKFLQILVFILVIASLVQLVEFFLKKNVPGLYASMGIYLPLITTNCAILAVTFDVISRGYNLIESVVYAVGVASGFLLSLVLLAGIRERIKTAPIPKFLQGTPILFVSTSLLAVAFMGFAGLIK